MLTDDIPPVGVASTSFSVLRVNRDLLSRSRLGIIATARHPRAGLGATGENYAYGADAQFGTSGRSGPVTPSAPSIASADRSRRSRRFLRGMLTELSYRGRVEFSPRVYAEPSVSWNRIEGPFGNGSTNLVSTRITLSPRMFTAVLAQFQPASSLTTSACFRWAYHPGSELFIVYADGRDSDSRGFPALANRSFVVKVTRLFRF